MFFDFNRLNFILFSVQFTQTSAWTKTEATHHCSQVPSLHLRHLTLVSHLFADILTLMMFFFLSQSGPRCVARFDFEGEHSDELSFSEGDVIKLKAYVGQEWARGQIGTLTGIFPLNFVEIVEDLPPPASEQQTQSSRIALPGETDSFPCLPAVIALCGTIGISACVYLKPSVYKKYLNSELELPRESCNTDNRKGLRNTLPGCFYAIIQAFVPFPGRGSFFF